MVGVDLMKDDGNDEGAEKKMVRLMERLFRWKVGGWMDGGYWLNVSLLWVVGTSRE